MGVLKQGVSRSRISRLSRLDVMMLTLLAVAVAIGIAVATGQLTFAPAPAPSAPTLPGE